jgi:hypothetical protein
MLALVFVALALAAGTAVAVPEGQMTWGVHTKCPRRTSFSAPYEDVKLKAR